MKCHTGSLDRPWNISTAPCNSLLRGVLAPFAILFGMILTFGTASAADESNCSMCHKNRGLSAIDEQGRFHLFYINQQLFDAGPHRRIKCEECHLDITQIPHETAHKVDCTQKCHITEPSGQRKFSHRAVAAELAKSVHSKYDAEGNLKPYPEDYPGCKDCHDQPLYRPISFFKEHASAGVSERALSRCKSCHGSGDFAADFFEHVTARLRRMRFPMETVDVCARCHEDPGFRERHDMDDVITSYKETFHGKILILGSERTADCLDCHVVAGESVHLIEAKSEITSAVHRNNIGRTCATAECHEGASDQLASFQTHVTYEREKYPLQFWMLLFFKSLLAGVMYFFLILIFLELLRRLFPNFAFFPEKAANAKADGKPDTQTGDQ